MSWRDALGLLVMSGGVFFIVVAAVGVVRLPDVYCRSHALGKATTLGIVLLLIGYGVFVPEVSWLKLGLAVLFQFMTIPVASHLFCLVAYRKNVRRFDAGQRRGS